jgi:hypothetical protein
VGHDISRDRMSVKSQFISALVLHFYPPCLQQVVPQLITVKSAALFLHDILRFCYFLSDAQVLG